MKKISFIAGAIILFSTAVFFISSEESCELLVSQKTFQDFMGSCIPSQWHIENVGEFVKWSGEDLEVIGFDDMWGTYKVFPLKGNAVVYAEFIFFESSEDYYAFISVAENDATEKKQYVFIPPADLENGILIRIVTSDEYPVISQDLLDGIRIFSDNFNWENHGKWF